MPSSKVILQQLARPFAQRLGKLLANLKDPMWYPAQAGTATAIWVVNDTGKKVQAYLKHHVAHDGGNGHEHLGDVHHDADGNEYFVHNGKIYRHDTRTDSWYNA